MHISSSIDNNDIVLNKLLGLLSSGTIHSTRLASSEIITYTGETCTVNMAGINDWRKTCFVSGKGKTQFLYSILYIFVYALMDKRSTPVL